MGRMTRLCGWLVVLVPLAATAGEPFRLDLEVEVASGSGDGPPDRSLLRTTLGGDESGLPRTPAGGVVSCDEPTAESAVIPAHRTTTCEAAAERLPGSPRYRCRVWLRDGEAAAEATLTTLADEPATAAMTFGGRTLRVTVTPRAVEAAPEGGNPEDEHEALLRRKLRQPVSLHFDDAPLRSVVGRLSETLGVNVVIDELGLADEGVDTETKVTLHVQEVEAESALTSLLRPLDLGHSVEDRVIKITSRARLRGEMRVCVYPVADLVVPLPSGPPGAEAGVSEPRPVVSVDSDSDSPPTVTHSLGELADVIAAAVEPRSWNSVGGPGTIRPFETTLSLVVRQTDAVHEEVAALLYRIRRERSSKQVAVETSLVTVDADFADDLLGGDRAGRPLSPSERTELFERVRSISPSLPKVTLFDGQRLRMVGEDRTEGEARDVPFSVRAETVGGVAVRLDVDSGAASEREAVSMLVADGRSALIDVTPEADGGASILNKLPYVDRLFTNDESLKRELVARGAPAGEDASGVPVFRNVSAVNVARENERVLLLVTPRIVDPDAEGLDVPE